MFNYKKKYKLTKETMCIGDKVLYRIKALKDFGDVKKGQLGGFVDSEQNLSQFGDCWVYYGAKVFNIARVSSDAKIKDNSSVSGDATICGNVIITDHASIYGSAFIYGDAVVQNYARVCDKASVGGYASIGDHSLVDKRAGIDGNTIIKGNAYISDNAHIIGDSNISGTTYIGGNVVLEDIVIYENGKIEVYNDIYKSGTIDISIGEITFYKASNNDIRLVIYDQMNDISIGSFEKYIENKYRNDETNTKLSTNERFYNAYMKLIELVKSIIILDKCEDVSNG